MKRRSGSARAAGACAQIALLPIAAYGVHQLRYLLAFGGNTSTVLRETGHSYLHSVVPWIVLLAGLAIGGFLRRLGRTLAGNATPGRYALSLAGLWLVCSACLIAIFTAQELLEGFLATGHPAGLAGVFGYGGWWAIPAAAAIGLVLATIMHGALWVLETAAAHAAAQRFERPIGRSFTRARLREGALLSPLAPLVAGWSGRGPPPAFARH